jgi:hypothetical protein
MKQLLIAVVVLASAGSALADHIGVYNDASGSECTASAQVAVPISVYVVHIYTVGAWGSQFKILDTTGFTQLGWTLPPGYTSVGNPYSGIGVIYGGGCHYGHVEVMQLDFVGFSAPTSCDQRLSVVADPTVLTGEILAFDCSEQPHLATGGSFSFFGDCDLCPANPAEAGTWGRVKSLYR